MLVVLQGHARLDLTYQREQLVRELQLTGEPSTPGSAVTRLVCLLFLLDAEVGQVEHRGEHERDTPR